MHFLIGIFILCFIPGFHVFYAGKISGELNIFFRRIKNPQWVLFILFVLNYLPILDAIPVVGNILELIVDKLYYIILMVTFHRIYEIYAPKKADSMIIVSIPLQFLNSFFIFKIRKNEPVNSKLILDYDFDGIYDEDVNLVTNN